MNKVPYSKTVYENLYEGFFKYRNVVPVTKKLSDEEFFNQMNRQKYLFIITKVPEELQKEEYNYLHLRPIYIILLSETNEKSTRATFLMQLKDNIKKLGKDKNPEIIFITEKEITTTLNEFLRKHNIQMYKYVKFAIIFPKSRQNVEHRIVKPEEEKEILERLRISSKKKLNKILRDDTHVIWIGAKVDDLIEIKYLSETTVYSISYRLVKSKTLEME